MNVICVDDERIILEGTVELCRECGVDRVEGFYSSMSALEYLREHKDVDLALLDIDMPILNGIEMAKRIRNISPKTFVVFATGYREYALDAFRVHAIGYLTKPIRQEDLMAELNRVRGLKGDEKKAIRINTFGNFEVFYNDKPVEFKYRRTKEIFAYLVDRNGVDVSTGEIMSVLFEDEEKPSYLRNLISDLVQTFDKIDPDLIRRSRGKLGLNKEKVSCDYYDYLDGDKELFKGEYMTQYSFSEYTLGLFEE